MSTSTSTTAAAAAAATTGPKHRYRYATLDVFTTERFAGNPLGVVHVPHAEPLTQEQEQIIAREIGYSESVFLYDDVDAPDGRRLDIFLPHAPIPWAGHPTIGALSYIAAGEGVNAENWKKEDGSDKQAIKLLCTAGTINGSYDPATQLATAQVPHNIHLHSQGVNITSILSLQPALRETAFARDGVAAKTQFPMLSIVRGLTFILVEVPTVEEHLVNLQTFNTPVPDAVDRMDKDWHSAGFYSPYFYAELPTSDSKTTRLRTRLLSPKIAEDPATGSAASALASYLSLKKGGRGGKVYRYEMTQGVEMKRKSDIVVSVELDEKGTSVKEILLSGRAVVVMRGELELRDIAA